MATWNKILTVDELNDTVEKIEEAKLEDLKFPPSVMPNVYLIADTLREYLEIREGMENGDIDEDIIDNYGFRIRRH